jgi:glycosyltransferase involved in cell wall biosynthesis
LEGAALFLRAAVTVRKQFPRAHYQIIGSALFDEADYEKEVRALTVTLGLSDVVEFTGLRQDVPELIARLDILARASTTGEPFGQVVAERMIAGNPVVATNGGGVPEIIEDGISGLLVAMDDAPALAAAIIWLVDNPVRAREIAHAGRQRILISRSPTRWGTCSRSSTTCLRTGWNNRGVAVPSGERRQRRLITQPELRGT